MPPDLTDDYGRTITRQQAGDVEVYETGGLRIAFPAGTPDSTVLQTFAALAPEGWTPPDDTGGPAA